MADFEQWNPAQANYGESMDGGQNGMWPGLVFLAGFAAIAIGAYLTYGTLINYAPGVLGADGLMYYGLTAAEVAALTAEVEAALVAGRAIAPWATELINRAMFAEPASNYFLNSFSTLVTYNFTINQSDYDDFANYMDSMGYDCYEYPGPAGIQIFCME